MPKPRLTVVALLTLASVGADAAAPASPCSPLNTAASSNSTLYDYLDPASAEKLAIVEANHFNQDVRSLTSGQTNISVAVDLDFILRAIPNHYAALSAMGRYYLTRGLSAAEKTKVESAECYFRRAITFRPSDPNLHVAFGVFLHQSKRLADARAEYQMAEELGFESAELHYNLGLLWFDLGDIEKSRQYADRAYSRGYPLRGLRNKLRSATAK
jgi:tetratricopeptide (TPR) repeat protein